MPGADALLLVDPYYNGPSSLEIRREYVEPVAAGFPGVQVIPYIIPGRTGCMMQVEDLAILADRYDNVSSVKEATGDLKNMAKTRKVCGDGFDILSGDDDMTVAMMKSSDIKAQGVISVASNVIPGPIQKLTELLSEGDLEAADKLASDLQPLFQIVTVATTEESSRGPVPCKARNPLWHKDPHECSRYAFGAVSPASGQDDEGGNPGRNRCGKEGSERRSACAGTHS